MTAAGLTADAYEFQMLLGVRPGLGDELVRAGHPVRVYVPFGDRWYEYSVRRLRENPGLAALRRPRHAGAPGRARLSSARHAQHPRRQDRLPADSRRSTSAARPSFYETVFGWNIRRTRRRRRGVRRHRRRRQRPVDHRAGRRRPSRGIVVYTMVDSVDRDPGRDRRAPAARSSRRSRRRVPGEAFAHVPRSGRQRARPRAAALEPRAHHWSRASTVQMSTRSSPRTQWIRRYIASVW